MTRQRRQFGIAMLLGCVMGGLLTSAQAQDIQLDTPLFRQSRPLVAPGETLPDYMMPNITGKPMKLSALSDDKSKKVLLIFLRGAWNEQDAKRMKRVKAATSELEAAGIIPFVLVPETLDAALKTEASSGISERLLLDLGGFAAQKLGVPSLPLTIEQRLEIEATTKKAYGLDFNKTFGVANADLPKPTMILAGADGKVISVTVAAPDDARFPPIHQLLDRAVRK